MKESTNRQNKIKELLYSQFQGNQSTQYGIANEATALKSFEEITGLTPTTSGLIVDKCHPYLAASPDAIDDHYIVEIKCPFSIKEMKIKDAIEQKKLKYLKYENGELVLSKTHPYYYQVQGQLHITNREICYFVVYTQVDTEIITIERNDEFCHEMIIKLGRFYEEYYLPEIVSPQFPKGNFIKKYEFQFV